jgi:hypothetical protein
MFKASAKISCVTISEKLAQSIDICGLNGDRLSYYEARMLINTEIIYNIQKAIVGI